VTNQRQLQSQPHGHFRISTEVVGHPGTFFYSFMSTEYLFCHILFFHLLYSREVCNFGCILNTGHHLWYWSSLHKSMLSHCLFSPMDNKLLTLWFSLWVLYTPCDLSTRSCRFASHPLPEYSCSASNELCAPFILWSIFKISSSLW